jgi:hypothetical protein
MAMLVTLVPYLLPLPVRGLCGVLAMLHAVAMVALWPMGAYSHMLFATQRAYLGEAHLYGDVSSLYGWLGLGSSSRID